ELLAADVVRRARAPVDLEARRAKQQLVQAPDGLGVGARVARAQGREPLARVGVQRELGHGASGHRQRDAIAHPPPAERRQRLGTGVSPRSWVLATMRSISRLWARSLRGRSGSWFSRLAGP